MSLEKLAPSKSERIGLAMKRIMESKDWKDSFGPLLEQELVVAQDDIAQAETVESVWKGVGRLQAYRYIKRAMEILPQRAEIAQDARLKKVQHLSKGKDK